MRLCCITGALALVLSACGGELASEDRLDGLSFDLIEFRLDGELVEDARGWVEFRNGRIAGSDGCNEYGIDGTGIWSQAQSCVPFEVQLIANAVGDGVKRPESWDFDGSDLRIAGDGTMSTYHVGEPHEGPPPVEYPIAEPLAAD